MEKPKTLCSTIGPAVLTKTLNTMKKISFFIFGAAAAFASVACSVETMPPSTSADTRVPMEFSAGISDDGTADSKTSINSNLNVLWSEGDAISVFDGTYNNKFDLTSGADSKSGSFSGSANEVPEYVALYPYSASALYANNTITASLPSQQYSTVDGSFETMLYPSVAKTSGNSMIFRNIAGLIRVTVNNLPDGTGVSSIQLSASESLTGAYTVDTSGDDFEAVRSGSESSGAMLTAKDGGNLAAGPYHIVVLPGEYTDFKVTVVLSDNSYVTMSGPASITANGGLDIAIDASNATVPKGGLYELYNAGIGIEIGGQIYSKDEFGEAELISEDTEISTLTSNRGVYFIDPSATVTYNYEAAVYKLLLIGNNPEQKSNVISKFAMRANPSQNTDGEILLYNVDFDATSLSTYAIVAYSNTPSAIRIINSRVQLGAHALLSASNNGRYFTKIDLQESTFKLTGNVNFINLSDNAATFPEINFINNVFYSNDVQTTNYRLFAGNSATISKVTMENNTFVNVYTTGGYFNYGALDEVILRNNLIYLEVQKQNTYIFRPNNTTAETGETYPGNPEMGTCEASIFYDAAQGTYNKQWFYGGFNRVVLERETEFNVLTENPFGNGGEFNIKTETFIPNSNYSQYGAQR